MFLACTGSEFLIDLHPMMMMLIDVPVPRAVVQLCYNQLTGSIPTQLGNLTRLTVLALQSNRLTGAIPASLGGLPLLARLDLSFNSLFGSIPVRLAQLPRLVALDVRNNSLTGSVPAGNNSFSTELSYCS